MARTKSSDTKGNNGSKTAAEHVAKTESSKTKPSVRRNSETAQADSQWEYIKFGNYYYYENSQKKMPIEWIVLEKKGKELLLLSRYCLDSRLYHDDFTDITWERCDLRKWLNSNFLNTAFSPEEQKAIMVSDVINEDNAKCKTKGGNDTKDRIFILSISEARKYFKDTSARRCKPTKYAISKNCGVESNAGSKGYGFTWWWLRSPGSGQDGAACVVPPGSVGAFGVPVDSDCAIRPALRIDLNQYRRKGKTWLILAAVLIVFAICFYVITNYKIVDFNKLMTADPNQISAVNYEDNIVKAFNHALFECSDYRKIRGDDFLIKSVKGSGMTVTYGNQQATLPYDARKPKSKNAMYIWSAADSKGFYVKPTMEGFQVYTYKTQKEMANNKMSIYSAYACGSFTNNTRYPFLHKEPVTKSFTDLFDTADLKLVRNSIFAAHGYVFNDEVTSYFKKYPWYHPGNNSLDDYTQVEKDNAKFIKNIEDGRKNKQNKK